MALDQVEIREASKIEWKCPSDAYHRWVHDAGVDFMLSHFDDADQWIYHLRNITETEKLLILYLIGRTEFIYGLTVAAVLSDADQLSRRLLDTVNQNSLPEYLSYHDIFTLPFPPDIAVATISEGKPMVSLSSREARRQYKAYLRDRRERQAKPYADSLASTYYADHPEYQSVVRGGYYHFVPKSKVPNSVFAVCHWWLAMPIDVPDNDTDPVHFASLALRWRTEITFQAPFILGAIRTFNLPDDFVAALEDRQFQRFADLICITAAEESAHSTISYLEFLKALYRMLSGDHESWKSFFSYATSIEED